MKSIVIYFSLTGNTMKVAKAIHSGMNQSMEYCDIRTLKKTDVSRLADYDLIAIGSPVWGGVPLNVMRFIDDIPSLKGKHAFVFCTHGVLPERFFSPLLKQLTKKGLTIIGIRDWYGSVYRPALPKPYLTDGHPDEIDLKEAENFGKEMVELSRKIYAGETGLVPSFPKMRMAPPNKLPRPLPKRDMEKCRYPECHLCMDHCPAGAIDLAVSPPVFARGCSICYFCEMICPEGAVEVDYEIRAKASLPTDQENVFEAPRRSGSRGSFRRLIPLEKVGWDTPYYTVYSAHPRYIISEEETT